ncbi:acyltransferase family protein [Bacteroides congonensis]|uniref:acyltransferase family protein n=1 Tax=Bacteroides congonensis TaxID=1871006 RepID=UPI000341290E|nr:acyltransferase [Bacteroides congonensis]CDA84312.1 putative succinyltransferase involved in succinoglycan biosynthesis [Bacteroides sp. CAG:754]
MMIEDPEKRQSEVIAAMRFPLMVLLLFAHVLPEKSIPIEMNLSGMNIYHLFSEGISHNLSRIRNPLFFLFSGFFFFRKMEEWSSGFYYGQLKKRIMSLMVPYLLWNVIMILAMYIKNYALIYLFSMEPGEDLLKFRNTAWHVLFWQTPVNYPLWFLRDLICMSVLSPLFYVFFKYLKAYGLLVLTILYLSAWESNVAGLSMSAFMFFGAGAYMGIYKKRILEFCSRYRYTVAVTAFLFLCWAIVSNGREGHAYIVRIYVLSGIMTAFNLTNWLMTRRFWTGVFMKLSGTVFFIYAAHEVYIINWTKGFFSRTSLADSGSGLMISYILIPFITLGVCLGLYFVLNKMAPDMLALMVGGRAKTQVLKNVK